MPRPPVIEQLDWKSIFAGAKTHHDWIAQAEFAENVESMNQKLEQIVVSPGDIERLAQLESEIHIVAFAEDWCGDVVRHVPVLEKLASFAPEKISTRYLARADAPQVFVRFLTNGGEAVPKFVFLSDSFVECGNWGPMQAGCRELIATGKACGDVASARVKVANIYAGDPEQKVVVGELLELCELAASTTV